jgi:hypothetical protein
MVYRIMPIAAASAPFTRPIILPNIRMKKPQMIEILKQWDGSAYNTRQRQGDIKNPRRIFVGSMCRKILYKNLIF